MPLFVLLHSPLVGPGTWAPVAERLRDSGAGAVVPSLLAVGEGGPPFWPRVVAAVNEALHRAAPKAGQPLVLVAHSNAGAFVPVVRNGLARPGKRLARPGKLLAWPVACSVFADATIPSAHGATPNVDEEFLQFLRGLAGPDGRLPRWSDWWAPADIAPLFPDDRTRELVTREQPRLPLAYFTEAVPVPGGWDDHPRVYLRFSPAYQAQAQRAAERGWTVRSLPGEHLHQLADPDGVARSLLEIARPGNT